MGFIRKYIFSLDHKVIGIQYFCLALFAALLGVGLSVLMRLRLAWPTEKWPLLESIFPIGFQGGQMQPEFYLAMVTMHGTIMVFMVLTTAPQGAFGNYFLPIQIGAPDMAFPVLNMLSFWTTFVSLIVLLLAFFIEGGAPIGGWTFYPPLSAIPTAGPGQGLGADLWLVSIGIFCVGSLFGALNFITTTLNMRAPGMTLTRMPLTCWAWFTTAIIALLAFPVLLAAGILLLAERNLGMSFFNPGGLVVSGKLIPGGGGSPLLWQHLFWFFGHPEVYIAILPGMGATSHILATFARKPIFGYRIMILAMLGIGLLGFLVWGHHMFISGMNPTSSIAFSVLTLTIGVPSAIKTFNWLGTLWGGRIRFTSPMLFAIGFVSLFVSGGLTGLILGQTSLDIVFHDTYFVTGHFHLIMGVAAVFGIFAATYFWFPKMTGRMMNESMGRIHFWVTFFGVYAIFIPFHVLGMIGHPRRIAEALGYDFLKSAAPLHIFISIAVLITVAGQLLFLANLAWSFFRGRRASENPWEATTLEWVTSSPPPHDNFGGKAPRVFRGPYEFSLPGEQEDYLPQHVERQIAS
ncbi:MAG: cbb3-type cytochrome c oxidase subunit I [Acidobacteriota bacterium]